MRGECVRLPLGCWKERSVWVADRKHPDILPVRGVTVGLAFGQSRRHHSCCVVGDYGEVETGCRDEYVSATSRLNRWAVLGCGRRDDPVITVVLRGLSDQVAEEASGDSWSEPKDDTAIPIDAPYNDLRNLRIPGCPRNCQVDVFSQPFPTSTVSAAATRSGSYTFP